ncbi:MAG TPA: Trm112 family protein [Candidatus Deferrimicrobium sp.]|nr:Trm112 family protein [Candidatus Deferrimicrobium sp.]
MPLSEKLLSKLACPTCKGKLDYLKHPERLVCRACRVAYGIVDNIPVLLADEAQKFEE